MGREYKLSCSSLDSEATLTFLKQRFAISEANSSVWQATLTDNRTATQDTWPAVFIAFKCDGIYFCDNLTSSDASSIILRQLIDFLLQTNVKIQIEEV